MKAKLTKFPIKILTQSLMTAFMVFFFYKILNELFFQYKDLFSNAVRFPLSLFILIILALLSLILAFLYIWHRDIFTNTFPMRQKYKSLCKLAAVIVAAGTSWLILYSPFSQAFDGWWFRSLVLIVTIALISWLLSEDEKQIYTLHGFLAAVIIFSSIYILAGELQSVSSYPLSLGWSEGNRLYDYSLLYGSEIYNYPTDLPIPALISTGRQALWGLPFLLPNVSIFVVRLWNVILFSVPYFLLGLFIFARKGQKLEHLILLSLWSFLFIRQGPIYAPLVLAAILVVTSRWAPWWLGMILVATASYYMRDSRFTWVFAPAMWAVLITFLEAEPIYAKTDKQRWLRAILLGGAGIVGMLLPQTIDDALINFLTGKEALVAQAVEATGTSDNFLSVSGISTLISRQPLLWQRLLPNPTYAPGILLGLLIAVGPLIALFIILCKKMLLRFNIWQKLILYGELAAFFVVGLIISVKIGGGGDLHNMDMFLITILITVGLVWHAGGKALILTNKKPSALFLIFLLLVVLLPSLQGVITANRLDIPSKASAIQAVKGIQGVVDEKLPGEILFIDQRQLLAFGDIKNVPLVPEYEKKVLMEMAMADDEGYFSPFIEDMNSHRFALIVSEPLYIYYQGSSHEGGFGSENDLWVKWVSIPILCNYEPIETDTDLKYQLLVPRQNALKDYEQEHCDAFFDEWGK